MPTATPFAAQTVIEGAVVALERLLALLEEETERLKSRNIEGLEQLLSEKLTAVQTLERCERERQQMVQAAGFAADPAGMQAFLIQASDAGLNAAWARLKDLLQRVQIINEANGNVIHRSLGQMESHLALLRGDQVGSTGGVYGPGGSTRGKSGGREISRA